MRGFEPGREPLFSKTVKIKMSRRSNVVARGGGPTPSRLERVLAVGEPPEGDRAQDMHRKNFANVLPGIIKQGAANEDVTEALKRGVTARRYSIEPEEAGAEAEATKAKAEAEAAAAKKAAATKAKEEAEAAATDNDRLYDSNYNQNGGAAPEGGGGGGDGDNGGNGGQKWPPAENLTSEELNKILQKRKYQTEKETEQLKEDLKNLNIFNDVAQEALKAAIDALESSNNALPDKKDRIPTNEDRGIWMELTNAKNTATDNANTAASNVILAEAKIAKANAQLAKDAKVASAYVAKIIERKTKSVNENTKAAEAAKAAADKDRISRETKLTRETKSADSKTKFGKDSYPTAVRDIFIPRLQNELVNRAIDDFDRTVDIRFFYKRTSYLKDGEGKAYDLDTGYGVVIHLELYETEFNVKAEKNEVSEKKTLISDPFTFKYDNTSSGQMLVSELKDHLRTKIKEALNDLKKKVKINTPLVMSA